jgi:hypothetical protein
MQRSRATVAGAGHENDPRDDNLLTRGWEGQRAGGADGECRCTARVGFMARSA